MKRPRSQFLPPEPSAEQPGTLTGNSLGLMAPFYEMTQYCYFWKPRNVTTYWYGYGIVPVLRQTLDGGAFLSGSVCLMRLLD
jgi:hypothetical protein